MVDTTDEWIYTRSGIRERRIADPDIAASDLSVEASKLALERAGVTPEDIDIILVGTVTPDTLFPSTACVVQSKLGCRKVPAFDFSAGCTGFIYGLALADALIKTGNYKNALVIGVDLLSRITDWADRATCVLFGDGAGAAVVAPSEDECGIISTYLASDGSLGYLLELPAGGSKMPASHKTVDEKLHTIKMKGNEVFKSAVLAMSEAAQEGLKRAGITQEKLNYLIPHQANIRIIDFLAERLKLPKEKVIVTIDRVGNTSASSIPIALNDGYERGLFKKGDYILMVAFGAGFTWGSVVLRWG